MVQQSRGRSPEAAAVRGAIDVLRSAADALLRSFEALGDAQRWDALAAVGELAKHADGLVVRMAMPPREMLSDSAAAIVAPT